MQIFANGNLPPTIFPAILLILEQEPVAIVNRHVLPILIALNFDWIGVACGGHSE